MAFRQKLDEKSLEVFNEAASQSFSQQCIFFLNAFWDEYGDQADYIYGIVWDVLKKVDMHAKGIMYIHKYQEGNDVDFDMGLYFFEQLYKTQQGDTKDKDQMAFFKENPDWKEKFTPSFVDMQTSIIRKKALRDSVDVNFDGRVGMLEYLLYQFKASPKDLIARSTTTQENPMVKAARLALEEVNRRIADYEAEKMRLENEAKLPGVKGLKARNMLHQLAAGVLVEALNVALIKAEAAVRKAVRQHGSGTTTEGCARTDGAVWWLKHDLGVKKAKYGRK